MEIKRNGTQPSIKGPSGWFTGTVHIDPLFFKANAPSRVTGASVTFEPGARTAWHSHPLGQTLIVTGPGTDGYSAKVNQPRKSVPAMLSGSRLVKSTGTAPHPQHP